MSGYTGTTVASGGAGAPSAILARQQVKNLLPAALRIVAIALIVFGFLSNVRTFHGSWDFMQGTAAGRWDAFLLVGFWTWFWSATYTVVVTFMQWAFGDNPLSFWYIVSVVADATPTFIGYYTVLELILGFSLLERSPLLFVPCGILAVLTAVIAERILIR